MRPAARLAAAIEILDQWQAEQGPLDRLLAAWGKTHRFAGKQDRLAIADRVYAALRRRAGAAHIMGTETSRALVLGSLLLEDRLTTEQLAALLAEGGPHAPAGLGDKEKERMGRATLDDAPLWIRGDYPHWLHAGLATDFGSALPREMAALAARAPLDLRVNTIRAPRKAARMALAGEGIAAEDTTHSPIGLRLPPGAPVQRSRAFLDGLVEVQDEGSQLVSLLAGAEPGATVVDLAAGAGGKSLALAAMMDNRGHILAADIDTARLERLQPRAERAGARIIETRLLQDWSGGPDPDFPELHTGADLVLLDAPCSGSGTWRRAPDAKWRLGPAQLAALCRTQATLLRRAAGLVKMGGRLVYVTCSILEAENEAQTAAFLAANPEFEPTFPTVPFPCHTKGLGILLTPALTGTDGFYCAIFRRKDGSSGRS